MLPRAATAAGYRGMPVSWVKGTRDGDSVWRMLRGLRGRDSGVCGRARSCPATVMVGQDHVVGNRNEERRNDVFGLGALFRGRADGHGGDRGRGPSRQETAEQTEVAGLIADQGLERAAVVFRNVGGHGGCLPGSGAGGPFSGPRVRSDDAGRELLKAGCGHAATDEPGALASKGRARCADPEPDRYSRCFVLPVKGVLMIGQSNA